MAHSETFNLSYTYTDPDTSEVITVSGAAIAYPSKDIGPITVATAQLKGDGYYGRSDGFHTVQINLTDFVGLIEMQGTLAVNPTEEDWFTANLGTGTFSVDTTGALSEQNITVVTYDEPITNSKSYNFTGNYVWVRIKVSNWTDGTINSIQLNH